MKFEGPHRDLDNGAQPGLQASEVKKLASLFMHTSCTVEVMVKPSNRVQLFMREKIGLPTDDEAMIKMKEEAEEKKFQLRGQYDFFDEKDRWQFLSKELAQKQELLHQIMRNSNDRVTAQMESEDEIKRLHQGSLENQRVLERVR